MEDKGGGNEGNLHPTCFPSTCLSVREFQFKFDWKVINEI